MSASVSRSQDVPGQSVIGGGSEDPKKPFDPSRFNPNLHYTEEMISLLSKNQRKRYHKHVARLGKEASEKQDVTVVVSGEQPGGSDIVEHSSEDDNAMSGIESTVESGTHFKAMPRRAPSEENNSGDDESEDETAAASGTSK